MERAERRAIAQMRDDDAPGSDDRIKLAQPMRHIFVGKPMKPVSTQAALEIVARQPVAVVHEIMAAMESRIKTGNLRNAGKAVARGAQTGDIMRLVQRRERRQSL